MKKYPIGFNTKIGKEKEEKMPLTMCQEQKKAKKSVALVYFPHNGKSWSYYNDRFDLKVGDLVYVEGIMEGYRGQVTEVNYSFKIKLSDYKKVIAVVDTDVKGDFYLAGSHFISFDPHAIAYSKVVNWFKAPESEEEYASGNDDEYRFSLDDLSKMKISHGSAERGHEYYMENRVCFVEIDGTKGRAVVEGGECYEVEFDYCNGEISNMKCSCFCSGACKHEFATMLQLKETLSIIDEHYKREYDDYFAIIGKGVFVSTVMDKKTSGKIRIEA